MYIPRGSNMTKAYGARDTYNSETGGRTRAGLKQAGKDVVNSYTGDSKEENIGGKVASGVVGGAHSARSGYNAHKAAIRVASGRTAKSALRKSTSKVVGRVALKGAGKAIGIVGCVPDAITAVKGFKKGYSSYGN